LILIKDALKICRQKSCEPDQTRTNDPSGALRGQEEDQAPAAPQKAEQAQKVTVFASGGLLMHRLLTASALGLIATVAFTLPSLATEGDWRVRGRVIAVAPDDSAQITPIGGDSDISTAYVPELDITYHFNEHVAAELILGVTPHDVKAVGTALGDVDLGSVTLLPPTLTLQYHFQPGTRFSPYVGIGINATLFFNEDLPSGSALNSIEYDPSLGLALQAGVDIPVNETWSLNLDVKKVFINTEVTIDAGALGTVNADVDIDPVIFGIGFGRKF
jgi:outer membrane protein